MRLFFKKEKIVLIAIIGLALLLRLINLSNWPAVFNQDEALNGYEAYSILKTGHDHRSNFLPIFFEGFDDRMDNRLPLYIYLSVPFVATLGLDKFTIRLPAALIGVLTIFITYLLVKEFFKKESVALFASLFAAISPWHIFLSRIGLEVILVPLFFILSIFFFLKWVNGKKYFILLSAISLGFLFYTYHIAKLLTPLLGLTLIILFWKKVKENKKIFFIAFLIFLAISLPLILTQFQHWQKIQGRFNRVAVFSFAFWPVIIIFNFLSYFTPPFFLNTQLFFILPLLLLGFFFALKSIKQKEIKLIFILILIALIPASLTIPNPHFTRASPLFPFFEIIAAWGLTEAFSNLKKTRAKPSLILVVFGLFFLSLFFINLNFLKKNKYPLNFCVDEGMCSYISEDLISYLLTNQDKYEKIVITNEKTNHPYIFFLFFSKYSPEKFQALKIQREYISDYLQIVESFDKYRFCPIEKCYQPNENNLYVVREDELTDLSIKKLFYNTDGSVFKIVANN